MRRRPFAPLALVGLLLLALPVRAQDPVQADYAALYQKGGDLIQARKYDEAIVAYEKCLQLNENDTASAYNLACCYARKGMKAEALQWLQRALEWGFSDWRHTEEDEDLASLRGEADFGKTVERMKSAEAHAETRDYKLHVPPSYDGGKPYPLVIGLHGASGNAESMLVLWSRIADEKGAIVLSVEGTTKVRENSYRWDDRSEAVILAILREVEEKYKIDPKRVYLCGFSQGGYLAYSAAMHSPDLFRGVVCFGGIYPEQLEYDFPEAKKRGLGVYIVHGVEDHESLPGARAAAERLKKAGVRCEIHEHPGGHAIPQEEWRTLGPRVWEWLEGAGK